MSAFVVVLKSNKLICVPENWLKNTVLNEESLVFFSKNTQPADFTLKPAFYFDSTVPSCYESRVVERFGLFFNDFFIFKSVIENIIIKYLVETNITSNCNFVFS